MDDNIAIELMPIKNEGPFPLGDRCGPKCQLISRPVTLSDYYITKYPITNEQYAFFIKDSGYAPPCSYEEWAKLYSWDGEIFPAGKEKYPVVLVSHSDAIAFCDWLNKKFPAPEGKKYRLPTEAEWEKAASWGPSAATKRVDYPWGNEFSASKCNCYLNYAPAITVSIKDWIAWWEITQFKHWNQYHLTPVNQYKKGVSRYGVFDMSGNVWEWCLDRWSSYSYHSTEFNTIDPCFKHGVGMLHVTRGGAWSHHISKLKVTYRDNPLPAFFKGVYLGFRIVCSAADIVLDEKTAYITDSIAGKIYSKKKYELDKANNRFEDKRYYPLSIIYGDLDNFKSVNDTHGHDAGDRILRKFFNLLAKNVSADVNSLFTGFVYNNGGDEIIIVLPNTELDTAHEIAETIRQIWERTTHNTIVGSFKLTASFGVCCGVDVEMSGLAKLEKCADTNLHEAKKNRNRVCSSFAS